jgi:hypothetical protein
MRGITLATNLSFAMMPAVMSLLIQPGRIAFAVTPWRASSTDSDVLIHAQVDVNEFVQPFALQLCHTRNSTLNRS